MNGGPHPLPLDPELEGRAREGLTPEDLRVERAALQVRRRLVLRQGRCSASRLHDWARWAAALYDVPTEEVLAHSRPLWRPVRRQPLTPEGEPVGTEETSSDPSRWRVVDGLIRLRAGTRDAGKSLFIGSTILGVGGIGWITDWGWIAQYIAPIAGGLLTFWSAERYTRRNRLHTFRATDEGLEVGERKIDASQIRWLDAEPTERKDWLSYTAQSAETAISIGLDNGTEEGTSELLAAPIDPLTAFTIVALLERDLGLDEA